MFGDILKDYFRVYKWNNFKALWKTEDKAPFFVMYWMLFAMMGGIFAGDDFSGRDILMLVVMYVPMLLISYSTVIHPVRLSKMMYLCPMDAAVRKKYIYYSYYFRVALHMGIAVISVALLACFTYCDILSCLEIILCDMAISLLIPTAQKADTNDWSFIKETWYKVFITAITIILNMVQLVVVSEGNPDMEIKLLVLGVLLLIQLPLSVKYYCKYVQNALRNAVFYEGEK